MKKATFYKGTGINGTFWMNQYPNWLRDPSEYNFEAIEVLLPDDVAIVKNGTGKEFIVGKNEDLFMLNGDYEKCWIMGGEYPEITKIEIALVGESSNEKR